MSEINLTRRKGTPHSSQSTLLSGIKFNLVERFINDILNHIMLLIITYQNSNLLN